MHRFFIIVLFLITVSAGTVRAVSYNSINIDNETVGLMTSTYAAEALQEQDNAGYLQEVLDHYHKITLSTTGIFGSKWMEQQALAKSGRLGSEESYHYKRIGYMVINQITPRLIRCGSMLVKEPQNAMYWGPYLFNVCSSVQDLCTQFEVLCGNGKIDFESLPGWVLLTINPDLVKIFDLAKLGDVDWKHVFEDIGTLGSEITLDDIYADIKDFGGGIAAAGRAIFEGDLEEVTRLGKIFKSKPSEVIRILRNTRSIIREFSNVRSVGQAVRSILGDDPKKILSNLFVTANLNITNYIDDILNGATGSYYHQRWYIYDVANPSVIVYEDVYDSQSMSYPSFRSSIEKKLSQLNGESEESEYAIGQDEPINYSEADLSRLKGCDKVVYTAQCSEGTNLGEQSFSFKVNDRGHNKKGLQLPLDEGIAMGTESGEADKDQTSELQSYINNYQKKYDDLVALRKQKQSRFDAIADEIRQAKDAGNSVKVSELEQERKVLRRDIENLDNYQIPGAESDLKKAKQALQDYKDDLNEGSGSAYRLQTVMNQFQSNYQLSWLDDGEWVSGSSESVFVRHAYSALTKGNVVFTGKISAQKSYRTFMGIRTHREIINVSYSLKGDYMSENTVKTLEFTEGMTDEEKRDKANEELRRLQEDYPSCTINMEYFYASSPDVKDDDDGKVHYLWASDRLEIARDIDYRITNINSSLIVLEKVLRDKESVWNFFKHSVINYVNRFKRANIAQICLSDWEGAYMTAAAAIKFGRSSGEDEGGSPIPSGSKKRSDESGIVIKSKALEQKGGKR